MPELTHPDKLLFPDEGLTKQDLADHYVSVADRMLPHVAGRPLTLVRCPSGVDGDCFFQKHIDRSAPPAIRRVRVAEKQGRALYGAVDSVAGLVSLVQLGALEVHTSNARRDRLERPDRFLIDLDPAEGLAWRRTVEAAIAVRDVLADLGLMSFVRTTGGKGLHVVVPITRRATWDEVREFSKAVSSLLATAYPELYTTELSKRKRTGRVLLDYMRNTRGATAIETYSTRARPRATVATPITWAELTGGKVKSDSFTVVNLPGRLKKLRADPWAEMGSVRQSITASMRRRVGL